jgi:acyl-CoA synthetase (AMP-forming)/AMP-acid ligase II
VIAMFGGASTPPGAVLRLGELLPNAMLLNGYGLTEGGSVCVLPPGEAAATGLGRQADARGRGSHRRRLGYRGGGWRGR